MVDQNRVVFNDRSLVLTAPPLEGATVRFDKKQRPQFKFGLKDNEVTVTVFTNMENDANKGKIDGKIKSDDFFGLMDYLKKLARGETEEPLTLEIKGFFFGGAERPKEKTVQSRLVAGKRKNDGVIYIALLSVSDKRPKIQFPLLPSDQDINILINNEPAEPAQISKLKTIGWTTSVSEAMSHYMTANYQTWQEIKERKDANKQNRGGGYNQGGGGGYQNNNQSHSGGGNQGGGATNPDAGYDADVSMW